MKNIFSYLEEYKIRSTRWFKERAHGTHAKAWLFALSFSEASFFVIPPDVLLIAILMAGASRWLYYALLTTVASVLGALFGYGIGFFFFDAVGIRIVELYHLTEELARTQNLYNRNAFWVIFTAAFTPIPYKVFVLSAGFFKVNFMVFLVASIIGRGLRYFLVAYITKLFGGGMTRLYLRYFNVITFVVVALATLFVLWYFL